jgi:hypothetical protein
MSEYSRHEILRLGEALLNSAYNSLEDKLQAEELWLENEILMQADKIRHSEEWDMFIHEMDYERKLMDNLADNDPSLFSMQMRVIFDLCLEIEKIMKELKKKEEEAIIRAASIKAHEKLKILNEDVDF